MSPTSYQAAPPRIKGDCFVPRARSRVKHSRSGSYRARIRLFFGSSSSASLAIGPTAAQVERADERAVRRTPMASSRDDRYHTASMRIVALVIVVIFACSKDSQHELGKAADEADHAAHEAAHAVASSASDDFDALSSKLRDVEGKLVDESAEVAHATSDAARKTASDAVTALEHERDELKAKLDAARAAHAGSGSDAAQR
jgi:hypothetical protein